MTQNILVLADEYAASVAEFAKGIEKGSDSMSPLASAAGDKRMALESAIEAVQAAQAQAAQQEVVSLQSAHDYVTIDTLNARVMWQQALLKMALEALVGVTTAKCVGMDPTPIIEAYEKADDAIEAIKKVVQP